MLTLRKIDILRGGLRSPIYLTLIGTTSGKPSFVTMGADSKANGIRLSGRGGQAAFAVGPVPIPGKSLKPNRRKQYEYYYATLEHIQPDPN